MQKRFAIKIVCMLMSLLLLLCSLPLSASATEITPPSMEEASAVYLKHLQSDYVVCSKNENISLGAGSTVKVMAGLIFCERLATILQEPILITPELYDAIPSTHGRSLKIQENDVVTVENLLYAAICGSYNDAFYLLAALIGGNVEGFLALMNERADSMGLKNTVFEDVTGIVDGSRTTAEEIVEIALVAYQNPLYVAICNTVSFSYTSSTNYKNVYNNNELICQYERQQYYNKKCVGVSAGSTTRDGNCVVTFAHHNDQTYVCVVMGGKEVDNVKYGYRIANRVIDWVFSSYTFMQILSPNTVICTLNVTVSDSASTVDIVVKDSLSAYLPKGLELGKDIIYSIRLNQTELEAPVAKDEFVGYVAVLYEGRVLGTAPLYTAGEASRSSIGSGLGAIRSWLENRAVIAGVVFFVVGVTAYIVIEYILQRRRHKRWDRYFSSPSELPDFMRTPSPKTKKRK